MKEKCMIMSYHLHILVYPEKNLNGSTPLKNLNHHDENPPPQSRGIISRS